MVESTCIYCGCGCKLNYEVKNNKIVKIRGVETDHMSEGTPCIKGLTIHEAYDKNRIKTPIINGKKTTLNKAFNHVYEKTKKLSPTEVFFNTSGKLTNENNFVLQKFARVCYETPNIDSCCGRLCHIATVMGMKNVFGTSNLTNVKNLEKIDTLFIIGSEPSKNYPVFYNKVLKKKDLEVIKIHSFVKTENRENEYEFNIMPGSETCLLNGIIHELIQFGASSEIEGFELLKKTVKPYDEELVTETCKLNKKEYKKLIKLVKQSKNLGVFHGMALTQHVNSLENIHSLLNLVLLKQGKILSLRGEINVQGVGDLGGSPGCLPTGDYTTKQELEKTWGEISCSKGSNIMEALLLDPVKAVFITEFDPFKSLPDSNQVSKGLKNTFIVYFGSYWTTTAKKADVVIPIASLLECEGSITNGEKLLRKVNKVVKGEKELWQVLKEFSKKFKKSDKFNYNNSRDVLEEITRLVKDYSMIKVEELWNGEDQWSDKEIKHKRFLPEVFEGLDDFKSEEYPFILTTYRSKYAFLSNEITNNSKTLKKNREEIGFYLNKEDAERLNLEQGDEVRVKSIAGELTNKVYISKRIPKGVIGAYIHYSELKINTLYPVKFDEESFTPNYKNVAVMVEKV